MNEMGMNSKSGGSNSYDTHNIRKSETKNGDPKIQMIG
tara:strand:- start:313 stop:426 length:114 start_codon:yes stop_codon:yes gene_type:complete